MDIRFATSSYQHDSRPISSQRVVNAFAEVQPPDTKTPVAVFGSPGIATFATAGNGPIRGLYGMNGVGYAVSGSMFYSFDSAGTVTNLGAGITGANVVSIDGDGTTILIVNGSLGFTYNTSTAAFAQIADGDFQAAYTVTFIDQRFAFDQTGTRKVFVSDILDGTSYNALAYATKESKPDRVLACRNRQNTLLVMGEKSIETWYDIGTTPFPFSPFAGGMVNRGLAASLATAEEDNAVFFLGDDIVFYRLDGVFPRRISTYALEREWAGYSTKSDAFCFALPDRGHKIIYLTFPTANRTFGYDIATQLWHERVCYDVSGAELRWCGQCVLTIFGKTLIGDANSGTIGQIDPDITTEFGSSIVTTLVAPPIHGSGKRVFMDRLELDIESGVGATTGQGSDPQIMLDWSDDGGRTWVSPQRWASMGAIGLYSTRVQWNSLGSFYQRSLRVSISDPVKRVILAARADVRIGT